MLLVVTIEVTVKCANIFSSLGKLVKRAIYFALVNFFFKISWISIISESAGPIFMIFSPVDR